MPLASLLPIPSTETEASSLKCSTHLFGPSGTTQCLPPTRIFEGSTAGLVSKVAGWEASWRSRCHVSVISKENVGPTPSVRRSALGIGFSLARTDACTVMNPLSSFEERTVRALPSSASQYASQPGSLLSLQYTSAGKAHSSATVRLHDIVRCGRCCRRPRCGCCAVYTTVYTHEIRSKLQLQSFICGRNESGGN